MTPVRVLGSVAAVLSVLFLLALGGVIGHTCGGDRLDDRGAAGQACYPNKTCDAPNTCFAIRKNYVCEKQISPALTLTADSCFTFQDETGTHRSCHKSLSECTLHFGATIETKVTILKGCS